MKLIIKKVIEELEMIFDVGSDHSFEVSREIDHQKVTNSNEEYYMDKSSFSSKVAGSKILNLGVPNLPITNFYQDNTIVGKLRERGV